MKNLFDHDYYERGEELGISGYSNYRWMPERTLPFCHTIAQYLDISRKDTILDYGCAKGFLTKAFCMLGYNAYGADISDYALSQVDAELKDRVMHVDNLKDKKFDWVISKDVLEHVPYENLSNVISLFGDLSNNAFIIVPLGRDGKYNIPEYENDITHFIREPASWWINKFDEGGFDLVRYSNKIDFMKDNWSHYKNGNGFFVFHKR